jgi:hypothetical protein
MVAQQLLELPVGVRIPARQPHIIKGRETETKHEKR